MGLHLVGQNADFADPHFSDGVAENKGQLQGVGGVEPDDFKDCGIVVKIVKKHIAPGVGKVVGDDAHAQNKAGMGKDGFELAFGFALVLDGEAFKHSGGVVGAEEIIDHHLVGAEVVVAFEEQGGLIGIVADEQIDGVIVSVFQGLHGVFWQDDAVKYRPEGKTQGQGAVGLDHGQVGHGLCRGFPKFFKPLWAVVCAEDLGKVFSHDDGFCKIALGPGAEGPDGQDGAALNDGPVEQALGQGAEQQTGHTEGAGGFAAQGDVFGIAAKGFDVFPHPLQRLNLVEEAEVADAAGFLCHGPEGQKAEGAEAVVKGHDHHAPLGHVGAVEHELGAGAGGKAAAVDVDVNGAFFPGLGGRGPDVEVQAVLTFSDGAVHGREIGQNAAELEAFIAEFKAFARADPGRGGLWRTEPQGAHRRSGKGNALVAGDAFPENAGDGAAGRIDGGIGGQGGFCVGDNVKVQVHKASFSAMMTGFWV